MSGDIIIPRIIPPVWYSCWVMWKPGIKWKTAAVLIAASVAVILYTLYLYGDRFPFSLAPRLYSRQTKETKEKEQTTGVVYTRVYNEPKTLPREALDEKTQRFEFDMTGNDVLVFLHIQKTGGSYFGKNLVKNLAIGNPCVCQKSRCCHCRCYRPKSRRTWLFSRYSSGWPCGVHADMTELTNCVPKYFTRLEGRQRQKRRFLYVTNIREPISRFLSEFRNVERGATWSDAVHKCNGRVPTARELPQCYSGSNWSDVTLDVFMRCPWNLAINRQTRMLADLSLVNCYNTSGISQVTRDRVMLQSAKENLKKMAYFGLVEYQRDSQYLFEQIIGLKFVASLEQKKTTYAEDTLLEIGEESLDRVKRLNHLDVELYKFASNLFVKRVKYFRETGRRLN